MQLKDCQSYLLRKCNIWRSSSVPDSSIMIANYHERKRPASYVRNESYLEVKDFCFSHCLKFIVFCLHILKEILHSPFASEPLKSIVSWRLNLLQNETGIATLIQVLLAKVWRPDCSNWSNFVPWNCPVWLDRFWSFQIILQIYAEWFSSNVSSL